MLGWLALGFMGASIVRHIAEPAVDGRGPADRALSDDVLRLVLGHLSDDAESLLAASQTCRRWRALLSPRDTVWAGALGRQWGEAAVHAVEAEGPDGPAERSWRARVTGERCSGRPPPAPLWKAHAVARGRSSHAHHHRFQAELARAGGRLAGLRLRVRVGPEADDEGRPEAGAEAEAASWRLHADSLYAAFELPAALVQSPAFRAGGLLRGALYPLLPGGAPLPPAARFAAPLHPSPDESQTVELCRGECSGALLVSGSPPAAAAAHLSVHGHALLRALRGEPPAPAAPLPAPPPAALAEEMGEAIAAAQPGAPAAAAAGAPRGRRRCVRWWEAPLSGGEAEEGPAAGAAAAGEGGPALYELLLAQLQRERQLRRGEAPAAGLAARAASLWGYTLYLAFRPECSAAAAAGAWAASGWTARLRLRDAAFSHDVSSYHAWAFTLPAADLPRPAGVPFPFAWHLRDATLYDAGCAPVLLVANPPVVVSPGPGPDGGPVFAGTFFLRVDRPPLGGRGPAAAAWWARTVAALRYEWDGAGGGGAGALRLELRAMPALVHALLWPPPAR